MDKMKVMISQPMGGLSDEQIAGARKKAIAFLGVKGYEVVNTYFSEEWYENERKKLQGITSPPLYFLAKSIEAMSLCHAVYFAKGWANARGCRIEHEVAKSYGLEVIYEE